MPLAWLSELFDKYVPATSFEMRRAYSHATPLNAMNWATSLVNILEVVGEFVGFLLCFFVCPVLFCALFAG